ncbi:hypothetical protein QJS10_CPB15g01803 [Acorus calamus]|uniref:Fatty acyl-CoA reductase n=1 Tax=Acorus calamus TaxID=4465 RepID=A0AAV9DBE5_ACOCL|nr:hypothetical protein QJS10_CPB15g01803 [Acorus calamus]
MDAGEVSEFFKHKSVLVTGSTGFIAKLFVEKILRIQPQVKKIYLLIRAPDNASVNDRMQKEVFEKETFRVLREKHGGEFDSFISNKVTPIAGDVSVEKFGIKDMNLIQEMQNEIHIFVHSAATTRFNERYEVALDINVQGTKNVLEFTRKCPNLHMLVHLSTAYVSSMKENIITEEPFSMENPLKEHVTLDISQEIKIANDRLRELRSKNVDNRTERDAMRELGVERAKVFGWANTYVFTKAMGEMLLIDQKGDIPTVILRPTMVTSTYKDPFPGWIEEAKTIDAVTVSFAKGELKVFPNDPSGIVDVNHGRIQDLHETMLWNVSMGWATPEEAFEDFLNGLQGPFGWAV